MRRALRVFIGGCVQNLSQAHRSSRSSKSLRAKASSQRIVLKHYFLAIDFAVFLPDPFLDFSRRSMTAATTMGRPTVASTKTSPNFPPSDGGTNLPHEIASL